MGETTAQDNHLPYKAVTPISAQVKKNIFDIEEEIKVVIFRGLHMEQLGIMGFMF